MHWYFSKENHQGMKFKDFFDENQHKKFHKRLQEQISFGEPMLLQTNLDNFPAIVQQKFLYLCVRIFVQIKAAKELRVALISV